jgi:transposase
MVTVETIGRIRRAFLVDKKPIRQIVRELRISRQTVRKAIRSPATAFRYDRQVQPQPRLGAFVARLDAMLEVNSKRPVRERLTARRLFELLRAEGYEGAYDSVQRHVRDWRRQRSQQGSVFIPPWFAPGEAYRFDWPHEVVVLGGVTTTVKVAHVRVCHVGCCLCGPIRARARRWYSTRTSMPFACSAGCAGAASTTTRRRRWRRSSSARNGASTAAF